MCVKMISTEKASNFAEEVLGISEVVASLSSRPLETLNRIIKSFHQTIPFQNVTLLAQRQGTQDVPDVDSIIQDVFQKRGGLCYTNNVFMRYFLTALGLQVYHASGNCNPRHPNNHIVTILVDFIHKGDKYLIDVGCGNPTYEAIPLIFSDESCTYQSGFLMFKFTRDGPHYIRLHAKYQGSVCCTTNIESSELEWQRYYDFTEEERELEYFQDAMREVYQDRFLRKFRALIFKGNEMIAIKEDSCVNEEMMWTHITLSPNNKAESSITNTNIIQRVCDVVPVLEEHVIKSALENWKEFKTKS